MEPSTVIVRKLSHMKVKKPNIESLKSCSKLLTKLKRISFDARFGNILHLLMVDVHVGAITALSQYYDPPLRCFTFRDFQLTPTLEEFARILGYSLDDIKPYRYLGHYPSLPTVAEILKVPVKELQARKQNRNGVEGIPQRYLEERMRSLAEIEDWNSFIDVLALAIYGIVLFPRIDEYIDFAAIDIFLAYKSRGENPVPAVLADLYCTLNHSSEKKGGKISCCIQVLYVWLIIHLTDNKCKASSPIEDFNICKIGVKNDRQWFQDLADLDERSIRWYPRWQEVTEVIYRCGDFPNVPLVGTKGCINYNPSLALRQFCYYMKEPPTDESITPFFMNEESMKNSDLLRKIYRAWDKPLRRGRDLGKRSCDVSDAYHQWLRDRVQKIGLPIVKSRIGLAQPEAPTSVFIAEKEVEELRKELLDEKEKNKKLQKELEDLRQLNEALQLENAQKDESLAKTSKRMRANEQLFDKTRECLGSANKELGMRNKEKNRALEEVQHLKESVAKSKMAEKKANALLDDLRQQLKMVVAEYKDRLENEKQQRQKAEHAVRIHAEEIGRVHYEADELKESYERQNHLIRDLNREITIWKNEFSSLLEQTKVDFKALDHDVAYWKNRYMKLAWLANQIMTEIPLHLKNASMMTNPLSTPLEILDFLEFCKEAIDRLRKMAVQDDVKVWVQCTRH